MKSLYAIIALLLLGNLAFSQTPETFNYQAVIGNGSGEVLVNTTVALRISILQDTEQGPVAYTEVFHPTTNDHGLVNLAIGDASFYAIDWGAHDFFLKVEVDPNNGGSFTHLGTSSLLSVPYALHARSVYLDQVDDADADPANELQTISLNGSDLSLSNGGGTVVLPSGGGGDNWGSQAVESNATLSGDGTSGDPLGVVGDLTDDQTLTLVGNDLSITDGNTVTLPSSGGEDNWGTQVVESDATLAGVGTSGDPLHVVGDLTDDQSLSLLGNELSISDGNSVILPTGADNWGTQVVVSNATLSGNGTSGSPLGVVGDLTDDQLLTYSGSDLSISGGNTVSVPSTPWQRNTSNIYYNAGNVGINTSSPQELFHVNGAGMFSFFSGSVRVSTPGSWPGFISLIQTGERRDICFRDFGISLTASTSSASPGLNDGIWILEGGNVGIQSYAPGDYPLFVNERSEYGLAISRAAGGGLWEIFTSGDGGLYLYRASSAFRGVFNGTTGVYTPVSDRSFKKEIKPLNNTLANVKKIKPSSYAMKASTDGRREIGLVAQELQDPFPELVYEVKDEKSGNTYHTVNYNGIAVIAIQAIQEQQEIIDEQAEIIEKLSVRLEKLERKFESQQGAVKRFR